MSHPTNVPLPPSTPSAPETPATTGFGWLLICFGSIPLLMWVNGDGVGYGIVGGLFIVAAIGCFIASRSSQPNS